MLIDENVFFREATLRICGSLEIEKALYHLLLYIRQFMPADGMGFHVHDEELTAMETVATATLDGAEALTGVMKIILRRYVFFSPVCPTFCSGVKPTGVKGRN